MPSTSSRRRRRPGRRTVQSPAAWPTGSPRQIGSGPRKIWARRSAGTKRRETYLSYAAPSFGGNGQRYRGLTSSLRAAQSGPRHPDRRGMVLRSQGNDNSTHRIHSAATPAPARSGSPSVSSGMALRLVQQSSSTRDGIDPKGIKSLRLPRAMRRHRRRRDPRARRAQYYISLLSISAAEAADSTNAYGRARRYVCRTVFRSRRQADARGRVATATVASTVNHAGGRRRVFRSQGTRKWLAFP